MAVNQRRLHCSPETVFAVLADGWLYPSWVVGTARMRDVDAGWPAPGSRLHHSVGVWPAVLNGTTSCIEWDPPRRMVVLARGMLIGKARVTLEVTPTDDGALVQLTEHPVSGPTLLFPRTFVDLLLWFRNTDALRRLSYLGEGAARTPGA
jgi:hypothetical protein